MINRFLTFVGIKHCTRAHGTIGVTANSNFSHFKQKKTVDPGVTITDWFGQKGTNMTKVIAKFITFYSMIRKL